MKYYPPLEKFCISKRPCNVLFFYINANEIPKHFTVVAICYERRDLLCSHRNVIFSHVKITFYFHV